ncbi:transcriptional regulator [Morganella psychrotolerans]|uniref:HTH cro/C1-type domain-containing protein n=1 Tax=Morganella psychrotolerans TaxID=368603 RepID=A0A1B8HRZ3_9GAMM|nr:transcriptional regulator [Morganella psychrotolerans]OBU12197.1 hypothetical protein AYY18_16890 [Morganella psychrotolerans]
MNSKKMAKVSFQDDQKESQTGLSETFKDRLKLLIGERSIRTAAKDWGLSFSTLNNYLTKSTDPALSTVKSIAIQEGVSLDWLVNGMEFSIEAKENANLHDKKELITVSNAIFGMMTTQQLSQLIMAITKKGVDGLLESAFAGIDYNKDHSIDSLQIRPTLKQAIKLAMAGDESLDQEILRRIEEKKNTDETGQLNQEGDHQKVG